MELLVYFLILLSASLELSSSTVGEQENAFRVYYNSPFPSPSPSPSPPQEIILDVTEFGAVGDGKTDDSRGFELAWAAACQQYADVAKICVPTGMTFLVSPIEFGGPCKCHNITFEVLGSMIAQPKSAWKNIRKGQWLKFQGIDRLTVVGNGQGLVDGQGDSWWHNADNARPTALLFTNCNNLELSGLKLVNSQKFHVSISDCNNANISRLQILAPSQSPNTDGIDIFSSTNIRIQDCTIETGDDCIAIKGGTSNLTISGIACGPGHGISIGSLGQNGKSDQVEAISITNCTLNRTLSGIRIKTWQGGSGFARNINFTSINFTMADNPVIIDQFYCPHKTCINKTSAVKVSDVRYVGLYGTSASKNDTISLRCSDAIPCTNIMLDNVDIKSIDPHESVSAICINAHGTVHNISSPAVNCLQQ